MAQIGKRGAPWDHRDKYHKCAANIRISCTIFGAMQQVEHMEEAAATSLPKTPQIRGFLKQPRFKRHENTQHSSRDLIALLSEPSSGEE